MATAKKKQKTSKTVAPKTVKAEGAPVSEQTLEDTVKPAAANPNGAVVTKTLNGNTRVDH